MTHRTWVEGCSGGGEVDLPQRLFGKPAFRYIFRDLGSGSQLFDGGHPFPVPLGAVVDLREFGAIMRYTRVY